MSNLTELQAIIQDIEDCGSNHKEAIQIIAECFDPPKSTYTVYGWLTKNKPDINNDLLELIKYKIGDKE